MIKRILRALTSVLIAVVVLLAILLAGVRLVGLQVYTVLSPSMEPEYRTGSVIYVKKAEPSELQVGDVITFALSETTTATHRIVEVLPDENDPGAYWFRTKGDANKVEDGSPVHSSNVIGTPIFTIPYLGYLASYIQSPPGMYVALAVSTVLILFVFVIDTVTGGKKEPPAEESAQDQIST